MSTQKGTILVSGDIGNIGFYERKGKYFARKRNPVDAKRIANDPAYERTRENMNEFSAASKATRLLRDTIRPLLSAVHDTGASNRLQRLMAQIKNMDTQSSRGNRNVAGGLSFPTGKETLKGFNFNSGSLLHRVLRKLYAVDPATGIISIPQVIPMEDVVFPSSATHMSVKGCWASINFATGAADISFTNVQSLAKSAPQTDIVLTPSVIPASAGVDAFLLLISFYQEVNGVQYLLKNGVYNALSIIEVV